jgi:hypothetical protein
MQYMATAVRNPNAPHNSYPFNKMLLTDEVQNTKMHMQILNKNIYVSSKRATKGLARCPQVQFEIQASLLLYMQTAVYKCTI